MQHSDLMYGSLTDAVVSNSCTSNSSGILWAGGEASVDASDFEQLIPEQIGHSNSDINAGFQSATGLQPDYFPVAVSGPGRWWNASGRVGGGGGHNVGRNQSSEHGLYSNFAERELILVKKGKVESAGQSWSTTDSSVVYECRICGRQCKWRSSISVHVRTHTGRKPYHCRVCHQSFADSSTRKKHEKKTHGCVIPGNKRLDRLVELRTMKEGRNNHRNRQQQQQQQQQPLLDLLISHNQLQQIEIASNSSCSNNSNSNSNSNCSMRGVQYLSESELNKRMYEYHNHHSKLHEICSGINHSLSNSSASISCSSSSSISSSSSSSISSCSNALCDDAMKLENVTLNNTSADDLFDFKQPNIPLPSETGIGKFLSSSLLDEAAADRAQDSFSVLNCADVDIHCDSKPTDLLDGAVFTEGLIVEEVLDEAKLSNCNQHLEFDKLEW